MPQSIEIAAPSRLHFGMFSFGDPHVRQFGGAGVMLDEPGLRLRLTPAERFTALGPLSERAGKVAERLASIWHLDQPPPCRLEVLEAPPEHIGLGTGTQLALTVTLGLAAWRGERGLDAATLAEWSGRGARSAVGTHGFLLGGLVIESGKLPDERLSPLEFHALLPAEWRFLLIYPETERGISGSEEQQAFCDLPPVPAAVTERLRREAFEELAPAARAGDFARFSESVYRFGLEAGGCFAARQGGPFASRRIAELVALVRDHGVQGVGQSSWGPAVFAVLEDQTAAERLAAAMHAALETSCRTRIARPNRGGARLLTEKLRDFKGLVTTHD